MKNNNTSEEIDLLSVLNRIKNGLFYFFLLIRKSLFFLIKNIQTLLIFIVIGVGISVGLFSLKNTVYGSDLTISHTRLNNGECYAIINTLTKFCDNGNRGDTMLSKTLNMDIKMASQIKNISCKALNETLEKNYKDSAFILLPFKIEVRVLNPSILDSLQKGILNYLESNEYATKRKKISREYLDNYEERIKNEIIEIDSLKRIVDNSIIPRSIGRGIILGEPIDPIKVYQTGLDLYRSKLNINEQRELNDSFEVIIGFSPATPLSSFLIYVILGFIFSFFLGLFWILRKKNI